VETLSKIRAKNRGLFAPAAAFAVASALMTSPAIAGLPVIVAHDNADLPDYAPQPDHNWSITNGGFGYNLWTTLGGAGGGGTYMEGVGVNNRQVDGSYSFALYAGGGSYAISRPLTTPLGAGEFDIITRIDTAGANENLFNLRTGNNTAGFGSGELLSFGIVNGNQLDYTDGSGFHLLPSGEARGAVFGWNVDFNAALGTYSATVTNLGGGYSGSFSGNLEASGTSVGSFAVINQSSGGNQNVIFDNPTFSVIPEPASIGLLFAGATGLLLRRKRR
jgi:hypothetical protein